MEEKHFFIIAPVKRKSFFSCITYHEGPFVFKLYLFLFYEIFEKQRDFSLIPPPVSNKITFKKLFHIYTVHFLALGAYKNPITRSTCQNLKNTKFYAPFLTQSLNSFNKLKMLYSLQTENNWSQSVHPSVEKPVEAAALCVYWEVAWKINKCVQ
jgi:hypothetical protein